MKEHDVIVEHIPSNNCEIKYNGLMSKSVKISFPDTTYDKTLKFAEHIDCVSRTENPQPSDAIRKVFRTILGYYSDERFQKCLEEEGLDTLAYVQRCIKRGMKESLGENKGKEIKKADTQKGYLPVNKKRHRINRTQSQCNCCYTNHSYYAV